MAELYKIFNKVENLYKVKLLDLVKVYLDFSLDKLWKAITDPLLKINKPTPTTNLS